MILLCPICRWLYYTQENISYKIDTLNNALVSELFFGILPKI